MDTVKSILIFQPVSECMSTMVKRPDVSILKKPIPEWTYDDVCQLTTVTVPDVAEEYEHVASFAHRLSEWFDACDKSSWDETFISGMLRAIYKLLSQHMFMPRTKQIPKKYTVEWQNTKLDLFKHIFTPNLYNVPLSDGTTFIDTIAKSHMFPMLLPVFEQECKDAIDDEYVRTIRCITLILWALRDEAASHKHSIPEWVNQPDIVDEIFDMKESTADALVAPFVRQWIHSFDEDIEQDSDDESDQDDSDQDDSDQDSLAEEDDEEDEPEDNDPDASRPTSPNVDFDTLLEDDDEDQALSDDEEEHEPEDEEEEHEVEDEEADHEPEEDEEEDDTDVEDDTIPLELEELEKQSSAFYEAQAYFSGDASTLNLSSEEARIAQAKLAERFRSFHQRFHTIRDFMREDEYPAVLARLEKAATAKRKRSRSNDTLASDAKRVAESNEDSPSNNSDV